MMRFKWFKGFFGLLSLSRPAQVTLKIPLPSPITMDFFKLVRAKKQELQQTKTSATPQQTPKPQLKRKIDQVVQVQQVPTTPTPKNPSYKIYKNEIYVRRKLPKSIRDLLEPQQGKFRKQIRRHSCIVITQLWRTTDSQFIIVITVYWRKAIAAKGMLSSCMRVSLLIQSSIGPACATFR